MINEKENKERLTLYQQGLNDREIAEQLFVSESTIYYWRKKQGLPPNKKDNWKIRYKLYQQGLNDKQIAMQLNVTPDCIFTWRKRNNLPANAKSGRPRREVNQMSKVMISGEGECIPVEKSELPADAVLVNEIAEFGGCRCEIYHAELKGYTEYYVVFTDEPLPEL